MENASTENSNKYLVGTADINRAYNQSQDTYNKPNAIS